MTLSLVRALGKVIVDAVEGIPFFIEDGALFVFNYFPELLLITESFFPL